MTLAVQALDREPGRAWLFGQLDRGAIKRERVAVVVTRTTRRSDQQGALTPLVRHSVGRGEDSEMPTNFPADPEKLNDARDPAPRESAREHLRNALMLARATDWHPSDLEAIRSLEVRIEFALRQLEGALEGSLPDSSARSLGAPLRDGPSKVSNHEPGQE
jgi:hypothetical protein